ncbi:MAG: sigma-70 family RNA polymerase sigma factor [Anaerolineaceae bacterium]|nr:sigma-70 family RNA polymerase sigma factor [Anaerolineaceae bacterium]
MIDIANNILSKAKKGDDSAFTQIVEAFQTPVFNLCYRMLGDGKEAEDAAQETFLRAHQAIAKYDSGRSFGTWLLSIAAHYCIDQQRKRKLPITDIDEYLEETAADRNIPNPESVAIEKERHTQIQNFLLTLPEFDRAAIILRYWYEYSEEEICQTLDISISAVKSRLHRARRKLAKILETNDPAGNRVERMKNGSPAF